jgi:hypothetical protein
MSASHIHIRTDSETFKNWALALANLRRSFLVPIQAVGMVQGISLPSHIEVTGLRLLLELGLACSRPHVLDDPARMFGLLKYALCVGESLDFRLAEQVRQGDSHKRKVLSDEFGCGISFLIARELLQAKRFLDLQTAIDQGWVVTPAPKSRRPDYIALQRRPDRRLIVLEAKGTQSGRAYSQAQVLSGCEQVAQCKVTDGTTVHHCMVVGACLSSENQRDGTVIHVACLDPKAAFPNRDAQPDVGTPSKEARNTFRFTRNIEEVVSRSNYLRAACLTGDFEVSGAITNDSSRSNRIQQLDIRKRTTVDTVGSTLVVESSNRASFRLHVGLDGEVRERLLSSRSADTDLRASEVHERLSTQRNTRPSTLEEEEDMTPEELAQPMVVDAEDGTVMEVELGEETAKQIAEHRRGRRRR